MDELKQDTRSKAVALSLGTLDQLPLGVARPTYKLSLIHI